jgi:hypothetical protein
MSTEQNNNSFIENVFEIAFGDNAINKEYTQEEVLKKLREFSDLAFNAEPDNILPRLNDVLTTIENEKEQGGLNNQEIDSLFVDALNGKDQE